MSAYKMPDALREALIAEVNKFDDNLEPIEFGEFISRPEPDEFHPNHYGGWVGLKVYFKKRDIGRKA